MIAAVIAALAATLSEVGAIVIVGGNIYGYDQTLASAALYETAAADYADAVALGIVLLAVILMLIGGLGLLQQQRWRHAVAVPGPPRERNALDADDVCSCASARLCVRRGQREVVRDVKLELRTG